MPFLNMSSQKVLSNNGFIKALAPKTTVIWVENFPVCSKVHLICTAFGLWCAYANKRHRGGSCSLSFSVFCLLSVKTKLDRQQQLTANSSSRLLQGPPQKTRVGGQMVMAVLACCPPPHPRRTCVSQGHSGVGSALGGRLRFQAADGLCHGETEAGRLRA